MTASLVASDNLVSIVIPVFNGSRYVGEAIESALSQSWGATEVIVVNDGSDDEGATRAVLASFGDAIKVLSKRNGGVATALNAGIAAMRGKWFSWLSHDDVYHPLKVERYLEAVAMRSDPAIAFGDVDLIDQSGRFIERIEMTRGYDEASPQSAVLYGRINGCAMLIPRICLEENGGFDPALPTTQDYAYWFRLARRYPLVPVRQSLVRSRVHAEQGSRNRRHLEEASLLWVRMIEESTGEGPTPDDAQSSIKTLRPICEFLRITSYAGAAAFAEARMNRLLRGVPVAVVCPLESSGTAQVLLRLAEAGCWCSQLILTSCDDDALVMVQHDRATWQVPTRIIRTSGTTARGAEFLRAASEIAAEPFVLALDPKRLPPAHALREGLIALAAHAADGWLHDAPPSTSPLFTDLACDAFAFARAAVAAHLDAPEQFFLLDVLRDSKMINASNLTTSSPSASRKESLPRAPVERGLATLPPLRHPPDLDRPTLLLFLHGWGGGTARYATILSDICQGRVNVLFAWGTKNRTFQLSSVDPHTPEIRYDLNDGLDQPVRDLKALGVARVDVLHSIGFELFLDDFLDQLALPFDITLLDYHDFALHPHLVDEDGHFIGDDALARRDHPIRRRTSLPARFAGAERLIACSRDLAGRAGRLAPGFTFIAARLPEPGDPQRFAVHAAPLPPNEELRVLYLGRIAANKGQDLIHQVVALAQQRGLRMRMDCLGGLESIPAAYRRLANLRLLGRYAQDDLNTLVCSIRPHLAWFPFTAPETHSFALSDAMAQGLPILATGLGAIPERVENRPATWVIERDEATPNGVVDWLERLRETRLMMPPRWLPTTHLPPLREAFYQREYLRPLC